MTLNTLIVLLINSVAIIITAYLLKGITVKGFLDALLAAVLLVLVNTFLKPVLVILSLPITILTFGFFLLVINALMIMLVGAILPGFNVKNFWWALIFSIVLSVINSLLFWIFT